jgi:hypothetical protein
VPETEYCRYIFGGELGVSYSGKPANCAAKVELAPTTSALGQALADA